MTFTKLRLIHKMEEGSLVMCRDTNWKNQVSSQCCKLINGYFSAQTVLMNDEMNGKKTTVVLKCSCQGCPDPVQFFGTPISCLSLSMFL